MASLGPPPRSPEGVIKASAGCVLTWSSCQEQPGLCGCNPEVPGSLVVSREVLSGRGSWAPGHVPLHLQSQQGPLSLVASPPKLGLFLTSRSLSPSIRFKGLTDSITPLWIPTSPQSQRCQETEANLRSDLHTPSARDPTSEGGSIESRPQLCLPHGQAQPQVDARSNPRPGTQGHVPALCGPAQRPGK